MKLSLPPMISRRAAAAWLPMTVCAVVSTQNVTAQTVATPSATTTVAATPAATTQTTGPALTLDDSIRIALRNHGDVGAAAQQFVSARAGITSARSGLFPQIGADINYNYQNTSRSRTQTTIVPGTGTGGGTVPGSGGTGGGSSSTTTFTSAVTTTGVSVSQNIFDSGRTRAQVRQARARALGTVGSFGSARSGLAYNVALAFYEQLRQEKLVAQRQGQVELARRQLDQIEAQVEAGVAARVDVQSVQVNLSQARFDLATAQNNFRVATTNFRNTLGLGRGPALSLQESISTANSEAVAPLTIVPSTSAPPTSPDGANTEPTAPDIAPPAIVPPAFPTSPGEPPPLVPVLKSLNEYIAEARRLRPDLLQARANVQSTEASLALAKISSRPQVSASAGYDIDPRSIRDRGFALGVGLSIPIFDAGGRKADVRSANAELEANRIRLAQLDKDATADVEASFVDIAGEVERVANARVLVESARINLATATERYTLGLGVVLDIVNAQTQLFNAQTSATQAVYDYELARANLDRAIGRFAWADPGQAPPQVAPSTLPKTVVGSNTTASANGRGR